MYLSNTEHNLDDFIKAINFIPPPGMSVSYIIAPAGQSLSLPQGSGFAPNVKDIPEDESVIYHQSQPVQKQDVATPPADYSVWNVPELGRKPAAPTILPEITTPEDLESPFVKIIHESKGIDSDILLKENWMMFPKNTLFHCVPDKLKEMAIRTAGIIKVIDENGTELRPVSMEDHHAVMDALKFLKRRKGRQLLSEAALNLTKKIKAIDVDGKEYGPIGLEDEHALMDAIKFLKRGKGRRLLSESEEFDFETEEGDDDFDESGRVLDIFVDNQDHVDWTGTGLADDELDDMGNIIDKDEFIEEDDPARDFLEEDDEYESFGISSDDAMIDIDDYEDEDEDDWDNGPSMSDDFDFGDLENE